MKACQRHWDMLREAIRVRGLEDLVAKDGEQAIKNVVSELEGTANARSTFDPLMAAYFMIVNNSLAYCGPVLMMPNEDGSQKCPICFIQQEHDKVCLEPQCEKFETWIERSADGALDAAKKLGLVGSG